MSAWIRAICRRSVAGVAPPELQRALLATDLEAMAADAGQSLGAAEEARSQLVCEGLGPSAMALRFRLDGPDIRLERLSDDAAEDELAELLDGLQDLEGTAAARVGAVLKQAQEVVVIEIPAPEDLAWPLALQAALWLAERGDGLVEADGCWFEPRSGALILESN